VPYARRDAVNVGVRTTIDLPEDLHRATVALARDRHQS